MAAEYDVIIVGGGPAGLSAAATIVRQDHKVVLFDSKEYRNAKSKHMHTVATWDHRDPSDFREAAKADYDRYGCVKVVDANVESLEKGEDGLFHATSNGEKYTAKKVVLATGVEDIFPDIPGYAENWVSSIFHCMYCHGWEEKDTPSAGVLATGDLANPVPALHFARQVLRMSQSVTLYTDGNESFAKDLEAVLEAAPEKAPVKIDTRKLSKLSKGPERAQVMLHFDDGASATEAFLASKPKTRLRGSLHEQLGLELSPAKLIKANPPFNQTSVQGVFAAGDCTNPMQTVTQALYSGTCTGAGAPSQIQAEQYGHKGIF